MASTPPAPPVPEPPTPLHGARYDSQPVRRSPRISKQRQARTPSPSTARFTPPRVQASTPHDKNRRREPVNISPPSSPLSPPKMQRSKPRNPTASTSRNLDLPLQPTFSKTTAMLPTPVKTPRKKEFKSNVSSAARVLFPHRPENIDDVMPTPHKKAKTGLSLESFTEGDADTPAIDIYTDSRDKVPEVDESPDNPFYTNGRSRRQNKRGKQSEHHDTVQEALERDEGMVYVFRGKKMYRKFEDIDYEEPDGGQPSLKGLPLEGLESPKPFTRSSVKPRFLFGRKEGSNGTVKNGHHTSDRTNEGNTSDEEAPTDIEQSGSDGEHEVQTPVKERLPATPPETNRTKRVGFHTSASKVDIEKSTEINQPRFMIKKAPKQMNSFENWARIKSGNTRSGTLDKQSDRVASKGKKRAAEDEPVQQDPKRAKFNAVTDA